MSDVPRRRSKDAEIQGYFCPLLSPDLVDRRLRSGKFIRSELGLEMLCPRCQCHWPLDTEYWFASTTTREGLFGWCRDCYTKYRWPDRGAAFEPHPTPVAMVAWGLFA